MVMAEWCAYVRQAVVLILLTLCATCLCVDSLEDSKYTHVYFTTKL